MLKQVLGIVERCGQPRRRNSGELCEQSQFGLIG
jgi:hypothetical protein